MRRSGSADVASGLAHVRGVVETNADDLRVRTNRRLPLHFGQCHARVLPARRDGSAQQVLEGGDSVVEPGDGVTLDDTEAGATVGHAEPGEPHAVTTGAGARRPRFSSSGSTSRVKSARPAL